MYKRIREHFCSVNNLSDHSNSVQFSSAQSVWSTPQSIQGTSQWQDFLEKVSRKQFKSLELFAADHRLHPNFSIPNVSNSSIQLKSAEESVCSKSCVSSEYSNINRTKWINEFVKCEFIVWMPNERSFKRRICNSKKELQIKVTNLLLKI